MKRRNNVVYLLQESLRQRSWNIWTPWVFANATEARSRSPETTKTSSVPHTVRSDAIDLPPSSEKFLSQHAPTLIKHFASGCDVNPEAIEPVLDRVLAGTVASQVVQACLALLVHTGVQRLREEASVPRVGWPQRQTHWLDRDRRSGFQPRCA